MAAHCFQGKLKRKKSQCQNLPLEALNPSPSLTLVDEESGRAICGQHSPRVPTDPALLQMWASLLARTWWNFLEKQHPTRMNEPETTPFWVGLTHCPVDARRHTPRMSSLPRGLGWHQATSSAQILAVRLDGTPTFKYAHTRVLANNIKCHFKKWVK